MIDAEVQRGETLSWVAVFMNQAFDKQPEAQLLKIQLIGAAGGKTFDRQRAYENNLTLKSPDVITR